MGRSCVVFVDGHADEPFEHLLRRFNRAVQEAGVLSELSQRQYFEKPSLRRHHQEQKMRRKIAAQAKEQAAEEETIVIKRPRRDVIKNEAGRLTEAGWRVIEKGGKNVRET